MSEPSLDMNRAFWDAIGPSTTATALPRCGPLVAPEEATSLLGDLRGKRVLELGCGGGHSLVWLGHAGAAELWGLDFSQTQLADAQTRLDAQGISARLLNATLEDAAGLPAEYFDCILSVFALGWSTHLDGTLARIATCLKPGGKLIFSWEHPFFPVLAHRDGQVIVAEAYGTDVPPRRRSFRGVEGAFARRTLGDWIAAVLRAGLAIEALIEPALDKSQLADRHRDPSYIYSAEKARLAPTTFIVKASKPCNLRPPRP